MMTRCAIIGSPAPERESVSRLATALEPTAAAPWISTMI